MIDSAPDDHTCLIAPEECDFRGPWAEALAHAHAHAHMPHPDDRAAWLRARRTFIGASEIGSVAGLTSRYRTSLDVYVDKVSPDERPMPSRARMGLLLEPALLDDFAARHHVSLIRPATQRHPSLPFIAATPDALLADGPSTRARYGVQVKVVGSRSASYWSAGPPPPVIAQVQTEMAVFDLDTVTVLAMIDSDEPQEFEIERDPEVFAFLAEIAEVFWRTAVVPRVLPLDFDEAPSLDAVSRAFPRALLPLASATREDVLAAVEYDEARAAYAEAKERRDRIQARLQARIGEREGFEGSWEGAGKMVRATWRAPAGSPSWKSVAEDALGRLEDIAREVAEGESADPASFADARACAWDNIRDMARDRDLILKRHTPALGSRRIYVSVK